MNIYVFDKTFNLLGIIDRFSSLIWKREFQKTGSFELHLIVPKTNSDLSNLLSMLQKGNILMKENSPEEAAYIESITLNEQEAETLVISGFFIDNFLKERIIWGMQSNTGTIEEVMKNYVLNNCITPSNVNRIIPNLILSENRSISTQASEVNSYGNLVEWLEELAVKYDVGWRVLFDLSNKKFIFDVYEGKDSSVEQSINPHVTFSLEYENVFNQTYTDSDSNFKNMALIGGQGEGIARKLTTLNDNLTGFDRREIFVDAKDIPQETEDGTPVTDEQYTSILNERGKARLSELKPLQTFESGISVLSNLKYKEDFDLGDRVTIQNTRWGVTMNTRITSIHEIYENNIVDIQVNFGNSIPSLIDKIKQRMR